MSNHIIFPFLSIYNSSILTIKNSLIYNLYLSQTEFFLCNNSIISFSNLSFVDNKISLKYGFSRISYSTVIMINTIFYNNTNIGKYLNNENNYLFFFFNLDVFILDKSLIKNNFFENSNFLYFFKNSEFIEIQITNNYIEDNCFKSIKNTNDIVFIEFFFTKSRNAINFERNVINNNDFTNIYFLKIENSEKINIENSVFTNNSYLILIQITTCSKLIMNNLTFYKETGDILIKISLSLFTLINSSRLAYNNGNYINSACIVTHSNYVILFNISFINNKYPNYGSILKFEDVTNILINFCIFKFNLASSFSCFNIQKFLLLFLNSSQFIHNYSYEKAIIGILHGKNSFFSFNCFKENIKLGNGLIKSHILKLILEKHISQQNYYSKNNFSYGLIYLLTYFRDSFYYENFSIYENSISLMSGQINLEDDTNNRQIYLENLVFLNNKAQGYGAVLFSFTLNQLVLFRANFTNCLFLNNTSTSGTLVVGFLFSPNIYITLFNCFAFLNKADPPFGSGLFNVYGQNQSSFFLIVLNCKFIMTFSKISSIYYIGTATLNSKNCLYENIYSGSGGIFNLYIYATVFEDNSKFINVFTNENGGISLLSSDSYLYINNSIFKNCSCRTNLFVIQSFSLIYIKNSIFDNNNISYEKGQIFLIKKNINFISTFINISFIKVNHDLFEIKSSEIIFLDCIFFFFLPKANIFKIINVKIDFYNVSFSFNENLYFSSLIISANSIIFGNLIKIFHLNYKNTLISFSDTLCKFVNIEIFDLKTENNNSYLFNSIVSKIDLNEFFIENSSLSILNCLSSNLTLIKGIFLNLENLSSNLFNLRNGNEIIITDCKFESRISTLPNNFHLFIFNEIKTILIEKCLFFSFISNSNGLIIFSDFHIKLIIKSCIFFEIKGLKGSCIHYLSHIVDNSLFINNIFEKNQAKFNGPAIVWKEIPPISIGNIFIENISGYGKDVSSYPIRMKSNLTGEFKFIEDEESGTFIKTIIEINLLDYYDQVVKEFSKEIQLKLEINLILLNHFSNFIKGSDKLINLENTNNSNSFISIQNQQFNFIFDKIFLSNSPGTLTFLNFTSKNICHVNNQSLSANEIIYNNIYSYLIPIRSRYCKIGEILNIYSNSCLRCPKNFYSLKLTDKECLKCPTEAKCKGGPLLILNKGFWRKNQMTDIFYRCTNTNNCIGESDFINETVINKNINLGNQICSSNYEGIMCIKCNYNYYRNISLYCEECDSFILTFFEFILKIFFFYFLIYVITDIFERKINYEKKVIIRIFIDYISLLILCQTYNVFVPIYYRNIINILSGLTRLAYFWFNYDCLIYSIYGNYSLIWKGIYLTLSICFISLLLYIHRKIKKSTRMQIQNRIFNLIYIIYPSFIDSLYSFIVCRNFEGKLTLSYDPDEQCWTIFYYVMIFIFYIPIILCITYLLLIILIKKKKNKRLFSQNLNFYLKTNISFVGYNYKKYYAIVYNNLTKFLLILVNKSDFQNDIKLLTVLIIFNYNFFINAKINPFYRKRHQIFNLMATLAICLNTYFLLWLYNNKEDNYYEDLISGILLSILILFHVIFLISLAYCFLKTNKFVFKLRKNKRNTIGLSQKLQI